MILATRRNGERDGELLVVTEDRMCAVSAAQVAPNLQAALDDWRNSRPELERLSLNLNDGVPVPPLHAPLPRAYAWMDGSAYLNHVILARRARGAEPPEDLARVPLMYQGGSDHFLGHDEPLWAGAEDFGMDLEAELAVVTTDVPRGVSVEDALDYIALILLCNDVTLRNIVPRELSRGFGFLQSKPPTAFAPFAVTPDELGANWRNGRAFLRLDVRVNGEVIGDLESGQEMHFSFGDLIAHAAKTRPLAAGTIIGSGTVSNEDPARGVACLAERRMRETLECGAVKTPYLKSGDKIRIEAFSDGKSVFGSIEQRVRMQ